MRTEELRARQWAAAERMLAALTRMMEPERKFNPLWRLQPRVPAGQTGGGRWTDGTVVPVNSEADDFRVSLRYNDMRWGDIGNNSAHTIDRHVGVADRDMIAHSVDSARLVTRGSETVIMYENRSTFANVDSAERYINEAIRSPTIKARLRKWLGGSQTKTRIDYFSSSIVGRVSFLDDDYQYRAHNTRSVRIIIRRDPSNPSYFYVQTAYPTSEGIVR